MDIRRPTRRSKSYSFSETIADDPPTPLHYLSIPFSWEQYPGIPKTTNKNNDSTQNLLPLPPSSHVAANHSLAIKKYRSSRSFNNDPFLAACVECSKDVNNNNVEMEGGGGKNSKRFVVSMYSSCKRTCAVSESIVYRPRSASGYILANDEDLSVSKSKP
ncbi:uncharacterized protein LOC143545795 [Bidens hawaiensis]|uniref:uncharacterized protein LOC143545795 n=1 Tax=Bidens hawaiensis TaxID=980011 RepID=UPI00404AE06D